MKLIFLWFSVVILIGDLFVGLWYLQYGFIFLITYLFWGTAELIAVIFMLSYIFNYKKNKRNSMRLLNENKLRRLTPKECFRLMGFFNDEINLNNLSDTQQYKLAGNGWTLRPAMDILKRLFK